MAPPPSSAQKCLHRGLFRAVFSYVGEGSPPAYRRAELGSCRRASERGASGDEAGPARRGSSHATCSPRDTLSCLKRHNTRISARGTGPPAASPPSPLARPREAGSGSLDGCLDRESDPLYRSHEVAIDDEHHRSNSCSWRACSALILGGAALFGQQSYRVILGGYRTGHLEEEAQKGRGRGSRSSLRDPAPLRPNSSQFWEISLPPIGLKVPAACASTGRFLSRHRTNHRTTGSQATYSGWAVVRASARGP